MVISAPLFCRLIDDSPDDYFEKQVKSCISRDELIEAIVDDLTRLLNTRIAELWKERSAPFSYGINATCPTSVDNEFEIQELESRINTVIKNFETRLKNINSHVINRDNFGNLNLIIDAELTSEEFRTPLSFPVVIAK